MTHPLLSFIDVTKRYGDFDALHRVTATVYTGDFVTICGPSGSGKSTLIHLAGLLDTPTEGTLAWDGHDTAALDDNTRSTLRGQRCGFVFQAFHLLGHRSVLDNVMLAGMYSGYDYATRRDNACAALDHVGLSGRLHTAAATLSGGEQQRVAFARAIATSPDLLLADEPTGNLDPELASHLIDMLIGYHASGKTIMMVTHNPAHATIGTRQWRIHDGHLEEAT